MGLSGVPRRPLTQGEISRIRSRRAEGVSKEDIASQFGVGKHTVHFYTKDIKRDDGLYVRRNLKQEFKPDGK